MVIAYPFLFSNLFFLPNKQAPSTVLRNEGRRMTQIQKNGGKYAKSKKGVMVQLELETLAVL